MTEGVVDENGFGQDRTAIAYAGLDETNGIVSMEQAMDILNAAKMVDLAFPDGYVCDTLWSVVYNSDKLTLNICTQMDYTNVHTYGVFAPEK